MVKVSPLTTNTSASAGSKRKRAQAGAAEPQELQQPKKAAKTKKSTQQVVSAQQSQVVSTVTKPQRPNSLDIPGLGTVTKSGVIDNWYDSEPVEIPVLGGIRRTITVDGYHRSRNKEDFHTAISNFLSAKETVLKAVSKDVHDYYKDNKRFYRGPSISKEQVWDHVRFGDAIVKRYQGDTYVSLECGCDWEREHGLQIVFKNGQKITKIGRYDGALESYPDPNVVYSRNKSSN